VTIEEYQKSAARTLLDKPPRQYTDQEIMLIWNALGAAGEAGELADDIKKSIFHDTHIDTPRLMKEMGDTLWYIAGICTHLGISMKLVMEMNITKLEERYPEGFIPGGGNR
jgi:NTP pyrophosphatase (non-canonical NTP hydrolase)